MTEADDARARWQLQMLSRLGALPEQWQIRFDELRERYGEPVTPQRGVRFWQGPQAPVAEGDLDSMSVDEIVAFLSEWQPSGNWQGPSPEGLGRVFKAVVAANPERFAAEATTFIGLDPTYVRALLGGLTEATRQGRPFPWGNVLELGNDALAKPPEIDGRKGDPAADLDPGWSWTWQESLRLITEGLKRRQGGIPMECRELVWTVIERLSEHPEPSPDIGGDETVSPATRSLNTIRGVAMHAAFHYAWWLREEPATNEPRLPDELTAFLARHLDLAVERSEAVRSVYGQWFPYLVACDRGFASEQVEAIFPSDPDLHRFWRAAWNSYVRFNSVWPSAFDLLAQQYARAIDEIDAAQPDDDLAGDVNEALASHIMSLYWQGTTDFGDQHGLLDRFYERAPLERRAQALEAVGQGLMEAELPSSAGISRLQALWARRLQAVRASEDREAAEELRGYAWWFASGQFDPAWSLSELEAMLEAGARVEADHLVAERLAALRADHPLEVLRTLEPLIEHGTREWFVLGARDQITAILSDGLAAGGEAESRARDLANRLVARGHREFESLLLT
jgi:hypothetical protein